MADGTEEYVSIEGDLGSSLERGTGGYESDMGDWKYVTGDDGEERSASEDDMADEDEGENQEEGEEYSGEENEEEGEGCADGVEGEGDIGASWDANDDGEGAADYVSIGEHDGVQSSDRAASTHSPINEDNDD